MWITTADGKQRLAVSTAVRASPDPATSAPAVRIDRQTRFQRMGGFGAAITDASAFVIENKMSARQRTHLLRELFGRDKRGLGLGATRLTIAASDFSRRHYSYADGGPQSFDLSPVDADVLPTVLAAQRINPNLVVMASPWSAPAWMKTSGSLITGELKPEYFPAFANYLRDYVVGMRQRGVTIDVISVQNEPDFEPANYPGMRMRPGDRARLIGQHLGPLFTAEGLATKIFDWDHNWDLPQNPLDVLKDADAERYIAGVAWHCYAGDVQAQAAVHARYPGKDVWMTECAGGEWSPDFGETLRWMTSNLIIGTARNWSSGTILWNLALDEAHGPHLGGCSNCRGVVTIDSRTGKVTRNVEYYVLGHASRFVRPGAVRVASDSSVRELETAAFENEDGSLVLIALNASAAALDFTLTAGEGAASTRLPAGAVATYVWAGKPGKSTKRGRE